MRLHATGPILCCQVEGEDRLKDAWHPRNASSAGQTAMADGIRRSLWGVATGDPWRATIGEPGPPHLLVRPALRASVYTRFFDQHHPEFMGRG